MKKDEHQRQDEEKARGFWSGFVMWLRSPYSARTNFSRTEARTMLILAIAAVAFMLFGGVKGLLSGSLLLWYLATLLSGLKTLKTQLIVGVAFMSIGWLLSKSL